MWSLRDWRRRRTLARHPIPDALWQAATRRLPVNAALTPAEQARLREQATLLLAAKTISGAGGSEPDDAMRVHIAALAALPLLGLDLDWYDNWHEIVVYPDTFVQEHEWEDEFGVMHRERRALDGESWLQGPVVLAWPEIEASGQGSGFNLVIHEIAHKLDMLNGDANGHPPLQRGMSNADWNAAFSAAYADMVRRDEAGLDTPLDPYAADAPEEFFAVASEAFFETPAQLHAAYPAVYEQLCLFYRRDPLARPSAAG
ncbi:MAG: M90 family metallopeptidase [Pseudomonadota bacterium]